MKTLKLIITIIKNLFLITYDESRKLLRKSKVARWIFALVIIFLLIGGGYKVWRYYRPDPNDPNLSLAQAAKIGQVTTHLLLVQIENRNCPPAIANGCYERGDIILIKPADFQFSDAEKAGFLILKMDLTDKQAEVLVQSLQQKAKNQPALSAGKTSGGQPLMDQLKIRKYTIDLQKIDIGPDMTAGRVVNAVYKWDIVKEK